jgi:hypothetical protein
MVARMFFDAVVYIACTLLVYFSRDAWGITLAILLLIFWMNSRPSNSFLCTFYDKNSPPEE